MKDAISVQLNIIFHKKSFQITFIVLLIYSMAISLYYGYLQLDFEVSQMYHPAMLSALNSDSVLIWFFCRLYPFLVIFPAGYILFADQNARISELLLQREGTYKYYFSKIIASFLATFFVFTIPFLLEFLLNLVMIPNGATKPMTNWETYSPTYFAYANEFLLKGLFYKNIYIYNIFAICLTGIFSGSVAVFVVGVSSFRFKYRAILLLPFYIIDYLVKILGSFFHCPVYLDFYITTFDLTANKSILYYVSYMLFLIITGVGCLMFNIRKGL